VRQPDASGGESSSTSGSDSVSTVTEKVEKELKKGERRLGPDGTESGHSDFLNDISSELGDAFGKKYAAFIKKESQSSEVKRGALPRPFQVDSEIGAVHFPVEAEKYADNIFVLFLAFLAEKVGWKTLADGTNAEGKEEDLKLLSVSKADADFLSGLKDELASNAPVTKFPIRPAKGDLNVFQARAIVRGQFLLASMAKESCASHFFNLFIPQEYKGMAWKTKAACESRVAYKRLTKVSSDTGVAWRYYVTVSELIKKIVQNDLDRVDLTGLLKTPSEVITSVSRKETYKVTKNEKVTLADGRTQELPITTTKTRTRANKLPHQLLGVRAVEKPVLEEVWSHHVPDRDTECRVISQKLRESPTLAGKTKILAEFEETAKTYVKDLDDIRRHVEKVLEQRKRFMHPNRGSTPAEKYKAIKKFFETEQKLDTQALPPLKLSDGKTDTPNAFKIDSLYPRNVYIEGEMVELTRIRRDSPALSRYFPKLAAFLSDEIAQTRARLPSGTKSSQEGENG
jgi:hypothetical protein